MLVGNISGSLFPILTIFYFVRKSKASTTLANMYRTIQKSFLAVVSKKLEYLMFFFKGILKSILVNINIIWLFSEMHVDGLFYSNLL